MRRGILFTLLAGSSLLPLAYLILVSVGDSWFFPDLLPDRLTLESWGRIVAGERLGRAVVTSLLIAAGTGVLAAALALPVGRALDRLHGGWRLLGAAAAFLPIAAPPIALGVGLQVTLLRLGLGGNGSGVLLAHLVPALGYTSLFFLGVFAGYDPRPEEEARTLGATPAQVLTHVTVPILGRPLLEAFALGFLVSWAQVPLTLLVGQGAVPTLAVEVLSYVGAGQDRMAATAGLLLALPPLFLLGAVGLAARRTEAVAV